MRAEGGDGLQF